MYVSNKVLFVAEPYFSTKLIIQVFSGEWPWWKVIQKKMVYLSVKKVSYYDGY